MRLILLHAFAAAIMLGGCTFAAATSPPPPASAQPTLPQGQQAVANLANSIASAISAVPPQPLAGTTLDDSLLRSAFHATSTAVAVIHSLVQAHVIVPGSAQAHAISSGLETVRRLLDAAAAAQRAGQAATYVDLLRQAEQAAANVEALLARR